MEKRGRNRRTTRPASCAAATFPRPASAPANIKPSLQGIRAEIYCGVSCTHCLLVVASVAVRGGQDGRIDGRRYRGQSKVLLSVDYRLFRAP
jgi:hypothetical protein